MTADDPAVAEALQQQAQADDAKYALLRQFQAVQQAQQQQAQRLRPPQTRQDWIATLMQQSGTTQAEAEFLLDHPKMMHSPRIMQRTMADIQAAGVQRDDSPEYFQAVEETFYRDLERKQKKAAAKAGDKPTPEFFQPPPAPPEQPQQSASSIYSAPVSREVASGGGNYLSSPNSIRLSREEREAGRMAGISEIEYALQKLRMVQAERDGTIQR